MVRSPIFAALLTVSLFSSLAAQEDRRHEGFGNDRSEGKSWGASRDQGGDRAVPRSDDEKEKPAQERSEVKREPRTEKTVPSVKGERGVRVRTESKEDRIGTVREEGRNEATLHHFNEGTNRRPQQEGVRKEEPRKVGVRPNSVGLIRHEISPQMKEIGIKRIPAESPRHDQFLRTDAVHSRFTPPSVGPKGQSLKASLLMPKKTNAAVIQSHMKTFSSNKAFLAQINVYNTHETMANHYYWHTWNGNSYCHYYDPWGYHWYGWYWHGSCFWARWYDNYWWWYDPTYSRWCYWNDGYWWWNDPYRVNVVYVYHDGDYVPSSSGEVEAPSAQASEVDFKSRNGDRTVKVFGEDAFLYDTDQDGSDNKPVYLASHVKEVKFSLPGSGRPMQIMLILEDGSFELFDWDGNPYNRPQDQP
ncbi:MAG TPA: hypothetical protein VHE12_06955 [bacterium]|nr:hypothetical protein [bacterium]